MEPFAQGPEAHVPAIHSGAGTDCGVVAKEAREGSGGRGVQRGWGGCGAAVVVGSDHVTLHGHNKSPGGGGGQRAQQ